MARTYDRRVDSLGYREPGIAQDCEPNETWCEESTNRLYKCNSRGTGASIIGSCIMDQPTITIGLGATSICQYATVVVSGSLKSSKGVGLANKSVSIRWGPSSDQDQNYHTVVTDSAGNFSYTIALGVVQKYYFSAYWIGDSNYYKSVTSNSVTCNATSCGPTELSTSIYVSLFGPFTSGAVFPIAGWLFTYFGAVPAGIGVTLKVTNPSGTVKTYTTTTDSSGSYYFAIPVADMSVVGTYSVQAYQTTTPVTIGNYKYVKANTYSNTFAVTSTKVATSITNVAASVNPVNLGSPCTITGKLQTSSGTGVAGATIHFNYYDPIYGMTYQKDVTTNASGVFSVTLSASELNEVGGYVFWIVFSGQTISGVVYTSSGTGEYTLTVKSYCSDGIADSACSSLDVCDPGAVSCESGVHYTCKKRTNCNGCFVKDGVCGQSLATEVVNVIATPSPVQMGNPVTITGLLRTKTGTAISGATIYLNYYDPIYGMTAQLTALTNSSGTFSVVLSSSILNEVGDWVFWIVYKGGTAAWNNTYASCSTDEASFNVWSTCSGGIDESECAQDTQCEPGKNWCEPSNHTQYECKQKADCSYCPVAVGTCLMTYACVFSDVASDPVNVVLGKTCVISGHLLTSDGLLVPGATVYLNWNDPLADMVWQKILTTDANGFFSYEMTTTDLYTAGDYSWWLVFQGLTIGSNTYSSTGTDEAVVYVRGVCDDGIDESLCSGTAVCDPVAHPTVCEGEVLYTCTKKKDCTYCMVDSGPCGGPEPKALAMTFVSGYEPPAEVVKGTAIEIAVMLTDADDPSIIITSVALAVDHYDVDTDSWVTVATLETGNTDCNCYPFALATGAYAAGLHSFRARSVSDVYNEVIINFDTEITTITPICTDGDEKCVDGYVSVCTNNAWGVTTETCEEEEVSSTGKYLLVAGVLGIAGISIIAFTRRK